LQQSKNAFVLLNRSHWIETLQWVTKL